MARVDVHTGIAIILVWLVNVELRTKVWSESGKKP
jgi:hypothetical protein